MSYGDYTQNGDRATCNHCELEMTDLVARMKTNFNEYHAKSVISSELPGRKPNLCMTEAHMPKLQAPDLKRKLDRLVLTEGDSSHLVAVPQLHEWKHPWSKRLEVILRHEVGFGFLGSVPGKPAYGERLQPSGNANITGSTRPRCTTVDRWFSSTKHHQRRRRDSDLWKRNGGN